MVSSTLIIVVSTVLLAYWFRYTCLLILRTQTAKDYAAGTAAANGLSFPQIQIRLLDAAPRGELPVLLASLERDYRLLTYLIAHTSGLEVGGLTVEQRMLMLDFKAMRLLCAFSRWIGVARTRAALMEMASVLSHLANAMGERAASTSRA